MAGFLSGQEQGRTGFSRQAITGQYAGSTGLFTLGYSRVMQNNRLELGLLYGRVPRRFGVNNSLVLKLTVNPVYLKLTRHLAFEPLQAGVFINQNFNKHLDLTWGSNYPKAYYWWSRSTRFHAFYGLQVSRKTDHGRVERLALYLEANTNDLYLASYLSNRRALGLYDILFFGTGLKVYLR